MRLTAFLPLVLASAIAAQVPQYRLQPATAPGSNLDSLILDRAGSPFATFFDVRSGPVSVLGETMWLGFTPALMLLDAGVLDGVGARSFRMPIPRTVAPGLVLFSQAIVLDAKSRNGLFRASNGESCGIYKAKSVLVERFDDAVAAGLTGTWDKTVKGRLMARPPSKRLVRTLPKEAIVRFGQPVQSPLNPYGERIQMVLRARDIGASGEEELVTAVHWRPFTTQISSDAFKSVVLQIGHSRVVPDYTVDRISYLPKYPASGLDLTFAKNYAPNTRPQVVYNGWYAIKPADLRKDGYMPYPTPSAWFRYNGHDSLLLDFLVPPDANAKGVNGQVVWLMVLSSPRPFGRAYRFGRANAPVDPFKATTALTGDNALHDYQLELTRVRSIATSPWIDTGKVSPVFAKPVVAASIPGGTSIEIDYRGARDAKGTGTVGWQHIPSSGLRFLQYRITLRASPAGARPSVDTLVLPYD